MEIWKNIVWLELNYQVSNLWNIRSLKNNKIKPIKLRLDKRWYEVFRPCMNWKHLDKKIHRVVAESFIDNKFNRKEINHKDWDKTNNIIENLEWVTRSYNNKHAYKLWLRKQWFWINNPYHREVNQYTKDWKFVKNWWAIADIKRELNIFSSNISSCCKWINKTAWWFIWKYNI